MGRLAQRDAGQVVAQALRQGLTRSEVAAVVGVSERTVQRVGNNLRRHGTPRAPASGRKLGRPSKMTVEQAEAIIDWIEERGPVFFIKDLLAHMRDMHGFTLHQGTLRRALVKGGYKRDGPIQSSNPKWTPPTSSREEVVAKLRGVSLRQQEAASAVATAAVTHGEADDTDDEKTLEDDTPATTTTGHETNTQSNGAQANGTQPSGAAANAAANAASRPPTNTTRSLRWQTWRPEQAARKQRARKYDWPSCANPAVEQTHAETLAENVRLRAAVAQQTELIESLEQRIGELTRQFRSAT